VKLPRRIHVGPHIYSVVCDAAAMAAECRDAGEDLVGRCSHRTLTIHIEPDQARSQMRDTLLHEVLHAVANMTALDGEWGAEREEEVILRLAPALLDVLRRNPRLVAFLTG
jgi:hypothetical protein